MPQAEVCSTIMATNRPKGNVKCLACTVETATLLYVLAGYVCVVRAEETWKVSFVFRLVAMLRTVTADKSQHQGCVAVAKQLLDADVEQLRASGDKPKAPQPIAPPQSDPGKCFLN